MRINSVHAAAAILTVLTLFSAGYWLIDQTNDGFRPLDPLPRRIQDPYAPRSVQVQATSEYATANGEYPQFDNASVAFNKTIQNTVQQAIDEHFLISEENQKAMEATDSAANEFISEPYPLTVSFDTAISNERFISVLVQIEHYSGGAHGSSSIHTFTYDVQKKKILALKDFFAGYEKNIFEKLSREARTQLSASLTRQAGGEAPDSDFLNDGTEPDEKNFELFTLDSQEDTITVYFGLYQVAPYVYGEQQITVTLPKDGEVPEWLK